MKILIGLVSFVIFLYSPSKGQEMTYRSTVDIENQNTTSTITKKHEILVTHDEDIYVIQFNIKHGRKIQTHRASVGSDKHFDKAGYSWVSKNKVAIKLFSQTSSEMFELKVWGETKRSTSMEVNTEEAGKS